MRENAFAFCFFIVTAVAFQVIMRSTSIPEPVSLGIICDTNDTEALLACGKRVPLLTAALYDLEQIHGISPVLAKRIHDQKAALYTKCASLPDKQQYLALTLVKGIGVKSALKISKNLKVC